MDSKCNGNNKMYRATKIWNECIFLFKNGMPVKRHRYHVRIFPDTFSGEEAANWLYGTLKLNAYFGQDVTKSQVIQLLNKFFKSGVFEGIKPMKNFKAGKQLYRFQSASSSSLDSRDPLAILSQPFDNVKNIRVNSQNDNFGYEEHDQGFCEKPGVLDTKDEEFFDRHSLSSGFEENIHRSNVSYRKSESSIESDSLQRLKNQLKKDKNNEYWKREDLKRDFLRRLISEKIQENQSVEKNKIFKENKTFNTCDINEDILEHPERHAVSYDEPFNFDDSVEKSVKELKNKCLAEYLMKAVIKRISNILGPYISLSNIIPYGKFDPSWIICNITSSAECMGSDDLPPWILDAAGCLGFFNDIPEEEKYPGYYEDVYSVLCENIIISCAGPLIPVEMNELIVVTFEFLEKLNRTESSSSRMTSSTEDLITDMLTPIQLSCRNTGFVNMGFTMPPKSENNLNYCTSNDIDCSTIKPSISDASICKQVLPADCCFETAFTSDVPVTRIIRHQKPQIQRAQSVMILKDKTDDLELGTNRDLKPYSTSSLKNFKPQEFTSNHAAEKTVGNVGLTSAAVGTEFKKFENKNTNVTLKRSKTISVSKRSLSCDNLKRIASKPFVKRLAPSEVVHNNKYNCYVNYGMSYPVDDCINNELLDVALNDEIPNSFCINYEDAIKDINKLVQYSQSKKSYSLSTSGKRMSPTDINFSKETPMFNFHENQLPLSDCASADSGSCESLVSFDLCNKNTNWLPYVEYLGLTLFRNELLLLDPDSRNKLNIILFLIHRIPLIYGKKCLEIKNELLKKLSCCILRSSRMNDANEIRVISQVIQFFVEHRQEIMKYVDDVDDHFLNIRQSNQGVARLCPKMKRIDVGECRKNYVKSPNGGFSSGLFSSEEASENTVLKLIYYILNDENCSLDEKKSLLKMLSDVYPDVEAEKFSSALTKSAYSCQKSLSSTSSSHADVRKAALQKLKNLRI